MKFATAGEIVMPTGTVKWFNPAEGLGFIAPDCGGPDVFVCISAVHRAALPGLNEGQKVQFDIATDPRDAELSAENLKAL